MDEQKTKPQGTKPLGQKAYGSIPHLPGSRLGPKDYSCHEGQARIACEKARDKHDRIIVQEKLDGSCCAVARVGNDILALGRAGWPAASSPYEQHQLFAAYVRRNAALFLSLLEPGERFVGEWLAQAHSTRYRISDGFEHAPFFIFDLMTGTQRATWDELNARTDRAPGQLGRAATIHDGGPLSIQAALAHLGDRGFHGALDPVEGAVWRVERQGKVDFLCKYVRQDKLDGHLLPDVSGGPIVWNWRP